MVKKKNGSKPSIVGGSFDLSQVRNRLVGVIELRPGEIEDHPLQAWDHDEKQAKALVGALREVGVVDRLLVYKSERAGGKWVTPDGHLRKSLDPNFPWPCDVVDLTDEEADYILATKDQIGMMKRANAEALDSLLSAVSSGDAAVQEMFTEMAARAGLYLDRADEDNEDGLPLSEERAAEAQKKWAVQVGDIWRIGPHCLVCGDCTDGGVHERLLAAAGVVQVNGVVTSPPYAEQRKGQYEGVPEARYVEWWAGVQKPLYEHLAEDGSFFLNIKSHCRDGERVLYVFDLVLAMKRQWGWCYVDEFAWTHQNVPGRWDNRFRNGFEPVYHFAKRTQIQFDPDAVAHTSEAVPRGKGGMDKPGVYGNWRLRAPVEAGLALPDNVLDIPADKNTTGHSAVFPVALVSFFIKAYSAMGAIWLDPFLGSGTTILSAAQNGRIGLGIEQKPENVALSLERLQVALQLIPERI